MRNAVTNKNKNESVEIVLNIFEYFEKLWKWVWILR